MSTSLKLQRLPNKQVQLSWKSFDGLSYYVQTSYDLSTWDTYAGPYAGEDDTELVLPIPANDSNSNFRLLITVPNDFDVPAWTITAFDGRYVILNWENMGPQANNANYSILRDGALLATQPSTASAYRDNTVVSGATYRYSVHLRP